MRDAMAAEPEMIADARDTVMRAWIEVAIPRDLADRGNWKDGSVLDALGERRKNKASMVHFCTMVGDTIPFFIS